MAGTLICDGAGCGASVPVRAMVSADLLNAVRDAGFRRFGGRDYCPECASRIPAAALPGEYTQADQIHAIAIVDEWNGQASIRVGAYTGDQGRVLDRLIAQALCDARHEAALLGFLCAIELVTDAVDDDHRHLLELLREGAVTGAVRALRKLQKDFPLNLRAPETVNHTSKGKP